jgi:hypothetical protein
MEAKNLKAVETKKESVKAVENVSKKDEVISEKIDKTFSEIISGLKNSDSASFLKTSLGRKESIYKKTLFTGQTEKEMKRSRKILRNNTESLLYSIIRVKDESKKVRIINDFINFYKDAFALHDLSVLSIASANTRDDKLDNYTLALSMIKDYVTKEKIVLQ